MKTLYKKILILFTRMSIEIEQFLDEKAVKIFKKYKNNIPFKIVEFAKDLGINVYLDDEMPDNISGKIEKDSNGVFSCVLNSKHSVTRHIFTIAHELGHYFRHQEYFKTHNSLEEPLYNQFTKDRVAQTDEQKRMEQEANEFAAELLMPEITVKDKWHKFQGSVAKMARYFNVSELAMAFRIKNTIGVDFTNDYLIV